MTEARVTKAELRRLKKEMQMAQKELNRALTKERIADRKALQQTKGLSNVCDDRKSFQEFKRLLDSDS